jgi:predicted murein hydrolase (TIGR00659 family)
MSLLGDSLAAFVAGLPAVPDGRNVGWAVLTLAVYSASLWVRSRFGAFAWNSPILTAGSILALFLLVGDVEYDTYMMGSGWLGWLLMPATVAMAIPLYDQRAMLQRLMRPILSGITTGSIAAMGSALLVATAMGVSPESFASLAPKSVTTPIAIGIGYEIGGLSGLIAAIVIVTGLCGIVIAPMIFKVLGFTDRPTQGIAYGLAAHAIGTAEALRLDPVMGSFAALALGINGIMSAIYIPFVMRLLGSGL